MKSVMKRIALVLVLLTTLPLASHAAAPAHAAADTLLVRYALLVGGREQGKTPSSSEVLGREELTKLLIDWNPSADNDEVRRVFALNNMGEVARQAIQLPLKGGQVAGVYQFGGASYEMRLDVRPTADGNVELGARMLRNGQLLSSPKVRQRIDERAILSSVGGPEAALLFFVVEVDRVAASTLVPSGLPLTWRPSAKVADGVDVLPPKVVQKVDPVYPEAAKRDRIAGVVVLRALVGKTGNVEDVKVLKGLPSGLTEAAVAAVRQWKFEPGRVNGKPDTVQFTLTLNFQPD